MHKEIKGFTLLYDNPSSGAKVSYKGAVIDVIGPGIYSIEFIDDNRETVVSGFYKFFVDKDSPEA